MLLVTSRWTDSSIYNVFAFTKTSENCSVYQL